MYSDIQASGASVALGPAGQQVIEAISVGSATSAISPPFSGQFNTWFQDGTRFLTNLSTTVWTYSKAGVQQQAPVSLPSVENLGGAGNYVFIFQASSFGTLVIYPQGSSTLAATYSQFRFCHTLRLDLRGTFLRVSNRQRHRLIRSYAPED